MCDPVSAMVGTAVVGGAVSAAGQLKAGAAEQRAGYENARALESQAADVREKAKFDIAQLKRNFERTQGTKITKIAGAGFNMATFADVLADDAAESYLERKAVKYNADIEAKNLESQARQQRRAGDNARSASYIGAAGSVISGVSSGISIKSKFSNTGGTYESGLK